LNLSLANTVVHHCIINFSSSKKSYLQLKHLIFFLLFLKFYFIKKQGLAFSFYCCPLRKNVITIYKAPYRFKLSKHQFFFPRFSLIFKFFFNFIFKFKRIELLQIFFYFFSSLGFCFYTKNFSKVSVVFLLKEWLK